MAHLTAHFIGSRLSYSTQALPINVLFDTLLRPLADTNPGKHKSSVQWRYEPSRRVSHVVLGNTSQPGGQWAENSLGESGNSETLSYAEMLSLPGYSFEEHISKTCGKMIAPFYRPTIYEMSAYLATYPKMVGIADSVFTNVNVHGITRSLNSFKIESHNIWCKHLVLASGVFSKKIPPPSILQPLTKLLPSSSLSKLPVLIVGSGFTAADVILSTPPDRKIIHIFKWSPDRDSPLQSCHPQAYPEYAGVYRQMKVAAHKRFGSDIACPPTRQRKSNPLFSQRDWSRLYEGNPNTAIKDVALLDGKALVTLEESDARQSQREISSLKYVIGRQGSLEYLGTELAKEVFGFNQSTNIRISEISGRTLRPKVEDGFEVAQDVFAIGSLTGDSLIRFAFGGCVSAARAILKRTEYDATPPPRKSSIDILTQVHPHKNINYGYTNSPGRNDFGNVRRRRSMSVDVEMKKCKRGRSLDCELGIA